MWHDTRGNAVPGVHVTVASGEVVLFPSYRSGLCKTRQDAVSKQDDTVKRKMRGMIDEQIMYFRKNTRPGCVSCGTTCGTDVDHIKCSYGPITKCTKRQIKKMVFPTEGNARSDEYKWKGSN